MQIHLQAKSSAKKIHAQNQLTLANLRTAFIFINAIYVLYRIVYLWSTFSIYHLIGFGAVNTLGILLYGQLNWMAQPTLDASGLLVDSGMDLSAQGLTSYMFDIIYIGFFVLLMTAFVSDKFWLTFLVVCFSRSFSFIRFSSTISPNAILLRFQSTPYTRSSPNSLHQVQQPD